MLTLLCILGISQSRGQGAKAEFDGIDVKKYTIALNISDLPSKSIDGHTTIDFAATESIDSAVLMLEGLTVDSILHDNLPIQFKHLGLRLAIALKAPMKAGDSSSVKIYYRGQPKRDASWGGFYFSGNYAFNLGVAFTSEPHNYGRVWFPCVDNFTDRAYYEFRITTGSDKRALCNGILTKEILEQNGNKTWVWEMRQAIPTYLASVAIAPYTLNQYEHNTIPVTLAAEAKDSGAMAVSFKNLPKCIDAFQNNYGPHTFDRIGFNLVPFNGGAMEHATNIAYPIFGADSLATYETLYAHELAHHWWGNTVTCERAEEMWINEGWASFSSFLFLEHVYGKTRYAEAVSQNHREVLHYAHLRDGNKLPVSGVSHQNTYGMHVYDKGADVVHTLRGYMGDSAFFAACASFMKAKAFQSVSSEDLKQHFQQFTTKDLNAFFDHWIYEAGFPAFDILEWKTKRVAGGYESQIRIRQRLKFTEKVYKKVPLELTAVSTNKIMESVEVMVNEADAWFTVQTKNKPAIWTIDLNQKISDAVTDYSVWVTDTGRIDFQDALMEVKVEKNTDSSFLRIEHYWVGPDAWFNGNNQPFLSRERYWHVDGVLSEDFKASATIVYNGRNSGANYAEGFLDNDLIRLREDSLVLMYRATPSSAWEICDGYFVDMKSAFDKRGSINIFQLKTGEYALAMRDAGLLSTEDLSTETPSFLSIYPNPGDGEINFEVRNAPKAMLEITSSTGVVVHKQLVKSREFETSINTSGWAPGFYYAGLVLNNRPYKAQMFIVR